MIKVSPTSGSLITFRDENLFQVLKVVEYHYQAV
jgi:hypothetical protein